MSKYQVLIERFGQPKPFLIAEVGSPEIALRIANHQEKILNEQWINKVLWQAHVVEVEGEVDPVDDFNGGTLVDG